MKTDEGNSEAQIDEDAQLMLSFKAGDRAAFDTIVKKYTKPLLNFIYRFTNRKEEAEDLSQEAFVRLFNAGKNYKPKSRFSTYIYRIAYNISVDFLRRRKLRVDAAAYEISEAIEKTGKEPVDNSQSVEEAAEQQDTESAVRQALMELPENQRLAIVLSVYEERSYVEIADILGVSLASVESLIFRARQNLKTRLKI